MAWGGGGHISPVVPVIDKKNVQKDAITQSLSFSMPKSILYTKVTKVQRSPDWSQDSAWQSGSLTSFVIIGTCAFGIFSTCVIVGIFAFNLCDQLYIFIQ